MSVMSKISPNLWFDNQAEEAVDFYVGIFKNARKGRVSYYNKEGQEVHGKSPGSVLTVEFFLEDQSFLALNGGPAFKFNEAVSLAITCETQEEIDYYWEKLSAGGDKAAQQCGWLKDKYGLSWQVTPSVLEDMFLDRDSEKSVRAMKAMLAMKKLIIEDLVKAYEG